MIADQSSIIEKICKALTKNEDAAARIIIERKYPFEPVTRVDRKITPSRMTKIFLRDGFVDRYRGTRLVYPPVLRIISHYLPDDFPYHRNWRMDKTHIAYWELCATIDHIVPLARGGVDEASNCICCSMRSNSIKANWTLEELQWRLLPPGDRENWDGMFSWFIAQMDFDKKLQNLQYIRKWYNAARAIANFDIQSTDQI